MNMKKDHIAPISRETELSALAFIAPKIDFEDLPAWKQCLGEAIGLDDIHW